jgi:hypothetical protein
MEEKPTERRVFWDKADISPGTKALVINVKDPSLTLFAGEQPGQAFKLFGDRQAYVESTVDEWLEVKDDSAKGTPWPVSLVSSLRNRLALPGIAGTSPRTNLPVHDWPSALGL